MSYLLSKSFLQIGKWTENKVVNLKGFVKSCKDVILKGRERVSDGIQVTQPTIINETIPNQSFLKSWKPQLQSFQSTLKENASKISMQLSTRNNTTSNSFFRNSLLWRRARKGHLIAFAGLFLVQEENQDSMKKWKYQYGIYESVCQNIQNLFPSYEVKCGLPSSCQELNDFQLGSEVERIGNTISYNAQLHPDEDDMTTCSSSETESDTSDDWSWMISVDKNVNTAVQDDFVIKAILPEPGVQRITTVIKNCQNELLCGGGDVSLQESNINHVRQESLPPHPNIMKIEQVFCDKQPPEIDAGLGHSNSSSTASPLLDQALYIVVKRYECSLRSYLEQRTFDADQNIVVIAQLLEAVAHLERHNIVHRDITDENIMIEFDEDGCPRVVLGGFGKAYCADSRSEMRIPFQHHSLDTRIGDLSSQAPEVANAVPGRFQKVNYTKSDAWMAGTVVYKLLTGRNPFKDRDNHPLALDARTYKEADLPNLSNVDVPDVVKVVVEMLLTRDPRKRLSAEEAADILHLELFATPPRNVPYDDVMCKEVRNWLMAHCAEALARKRDDSVPFQLCQSFFNRLESHKFSLGYRFWVLAQRGICTDN